MLLWVGVEVFALTQASPYDSLPTLPPIPAALRPRHPPEPTWEEQQTSVLHLAGDNFRETLKKKKHTLVMFYAPCK